MATQNQKDPKVVTFYGRLSFPTWTAQQAYELSLKGQYPAASAAEASPNFTLLVEQPQLDKFLAHVTDHFFPYCIEQEKKGEKRDKLDAKEIKALLAQLEDEDSYDGPLNMPVKPVHEKTKPLAPEAVAAIKLIGNKGVDIDLKAMVQNQDELLLPDPDQLSYPTIRPLGETVHQMYAGAYVAVTANLYAYHNGKNAGFSAGASTAVFKADGDRFGGGVSIDESEIFMD